MGVAALGPLAGLKGRGYIWFPLRLHLQSILRVMQLARNFRSRLVKGPSALRRLEDPQCTDFDIFFAVTLAYRLGH